MKVVVWHNLLWSRYKAGVFSALYRSSQARGIDVFVNQIAETAADRAVLSPVDKAWHEYPYEVLFKGNYAAIPRGKLFSELARRTWNTDADVTILAGIERPEFWMQALILTVRGKKFAVFCDSTINDNPQTFVKGIAKRLLFSLCSGVFCYGERSIAYVMHYGVPREKIFIRRQAAALPKDYSQANALARRIAAAPPVDAPRYLYVGRLSPEKSLDHLLQAFAKVLQATPAARLVIVGKGPQEADLKAMARTLQIDANVDFAGAKFDDQLTEEYLTATCLVLPSRSEPWGLVVNEALSFGCPVVVSDRCGCVPELVVDGVSGFGFPWGDTAALADRLQRVTTEFADPGKAGRACLDHIASFNPETAATGIIEGALAIQGVR